MKTFVAIAANLVGLVSVACDWAPGVGFALAVGSIVFLLQLREDLCAR